MITLFPLNSSPSITAPTISRSCPRRPPPSPRHAPRPKRSAREEGPSSRRTDTVVPAVTSFSNDATTPNDTSIPQAWRVPADTVGNPPPLGGAMAEPATYVKTRAASKPGRLASGPDASQDAALKTPTIKSRTNAHLRARKYG